ncbi:methionine synthase [Phytomonospora sp. NPDC050363]|uniref:methionine synthase n=1 Tax=Phytomonospora sp. NPDC050363 TaxID=3155642 RepID=UPI003410024B
MADRPALPPGAATGVGSLPGTDIVEATRVVLGELPDLPHLPELPARGPGADMIGRSAALLAEFPVELYAGRWQTCDRPGRDLRQALDFLDRDLDTLTEQADGFAGVLKVQSAGPWTLAASVQRQTGGAILRDPGAVRDLTDSLTEGLREHLADLARRIPGATLILQLDEPSLPAVLAGAVPTESGLARYRPVEAPVASARLRSLVEAMAVPVVVHSCAPNVPVALLAETGAAGIAVDMALLNLDKAADLDPFGEALDGGMWLFAGSDAADPGAAARRLWQRLGLTPARLPEQVVVTPPCGLAGRTPAEARRVLDACREAGRRLREDPEG